MAEIPKDPRQKRRAIENGELREWTARGKSWSSMEKSCLPRILLHAGLWATRLEDRGRRNALAAIDKTLRFEFDRLPREFSGLRILQLSDLHIDGLPELTDIICERLDSLEVDLCVLTGDYRYELNGKDHRVFPRMESIISSIRSRHGILGILGNHDSTEMARRFQDQGVRMLINEAYELRDGDSSLWFVGVDDPHYFGCDDLASAVRPVPDDAFKILLAHTPEIIDDAARAGIDFYLCGHTHGGQICLPYLGPVLINSNCPRKYARGAWRYRHVQGYTSFGIGSSVVPARFHCPPELPVIELHRTGAKPSTETEGSD
jgi:predicted MPP superfamily phosphohydrolase